LYLLVQIYNEYQKVELRMSKYPNLGVIILAAGQGKRMNLQNVNKVTLSLRNKPIILHITHFMNRLGINTIIVVVGHAKESVMEVLKNEEHVLFAEQKERLGTGHAVQCALKKLPEYITDVLVVYGDDAVFYIDKHIPLLEKLIATHFSEKNAFSFLTIEKEIPFGLGRVVRDKNDALVAIVEEKDATDEQKEITEINPGCFIFSSSFLKKYLPLVERSPVTGEYYLTSLIDIAIKNRENITAVRGGRLSWRGVNTPEELKEAEHVLNSL